MADEDRTAHTHARPRRVPPPLAAPDYRKNINQRLGAGRGDRRGPDALGICQGDAARWIQGMGRNKTHRFNFEKPTTVSHARPRK